MWYKEQENGEWLKASETVILPNGTVLQKDKTEVVDGWFWSEKEPEPFTKWNEVVNDLHKTTLT